MEKTTLSPAIILDRDGTLHRDTHYLIRFEDFEVLPGVEEALKILLEKGYRLFAATNQSGVARGMFPLEKVL
ncbi:MAG TPA: D,D-heptose 1,7-bisphosphate phosphatase, partial [Fibrobacteres bacterium]|nr:D,D-heptose 1,7-bisphosphate phosphatase [Fibrobacterota bacterium]